MKTLIFTQMLFICAAGVSAQEAGVFLKMPMSARGMGIGDAFTAISDEPQGMHYNPAGPALVKGISISAVHHSYLQDISGDTAGVVIPAGNYTLSASPALFKMKREPIYDSVGVDTGRSFGYEAAIVPVGLARRFGRLSLGAVYKSYSEKIDDQQARTSTFDAGAIYDIGRLRLGFSSQNNGGKLYDYALSRVQRAGAAYIGDDFVAAADFVKEGSIGSNYGFGAETSLLGALRLRAGLRVRESFGGPTFGLGLKIGKLYADYAFAGYGELGNAHKFGLTMSFGPFAKKPLVTPIPRGASNSDPELMYTGEENFTSTAISTSVGNTGTDFTYRIMYKDMDGDSPDDGYPRIHVLKGGSGLVGSPFQMNYISGENKSGAIYSLSKKFAAGNDYSYYFEARDSRGGKASGQMTSAVPGPLVAQLEAERMSGGLNLAIAEFTGKNVSQADASIVGDFLRTELVNTGLFNVMDRNNMDTILAEQKFQNSGCTEQQCAVEMGKLLNVQKMLVGSLSKLLDTYYITVNVIDVETGKIGVSYDMDAANARELKDACQRIAAKIAGK